MQNNGVSIAVFFILIFFWIFFHHASEQSLIVSQEHQAPEQEDEEIIFIYEQSCQENKWVIFKAQSYYDTIWGIDNSISPADYIKRKKERDILSVCRSAYGYGQIACDEAEAMAQNQYSQKQLLSMMVQRINAFKKSDSSTRFDELLRMWMEDITFLTSKKELRYGSIIDQINRWQWNLWDCLEASNELKESFDNWNWTNQINGQTSAVFYNRNLIRYDTMKYLDLPIPQQVYRDYLIPWEAIWNPWIKTPAQRVKEIKPSLYNKAQVQIAKVPSNMIYNPASPWFNQRAFSIFVEEVIQPIDVQKYIQYQAINNTDNNRAQYKSWLQQKWMTMSASSLPNIETTPVPIIEDTTPISIPVIDTPQLVAQPTAPQPIETSPKITPISIPTIPIEKVTQPAVQVILPSTPSNGSTAKDTTPSVNPYLQLTQPSTTTTNNAYNTYNPY